jgi:O-antigen/teichoic acid export membrane protein
MRKQTFLKHAGVYALGDFLVLAGGFVLLPLYTRVLSVSAFGVLEVLDRMAEIVAICLIARGLAQAVMALYRQSETEQQRRRVIGAALLLGAVLTVIGTAVLALVAGVLGTALQVDSGLLLWTAGVVALLDGLAVLMQTANQARFESIVYVTVALAQFLVKVGLSILFVAGFGWGIWGVVAASLVRSVCFVMLLLVWECWRGVAWPDTRTVREMLAFAMPFVPAGLCFFVLNSADRFFLLGWVSPSEVGIYGLGYRLATLVGLFSLTPLFRVWSARMHDAARAADAAIVFGRMTTYLLGSYLLLGLGLCLLEDHVIALFAGPAFAGAALIVPPVVLAYFFQAAGVLFDAGFYVRRQTQWKLWIVLASTVVMLLLYALWIPRLGLLGAALATLVGFLFHAVATCCVAQRVFPVRYEWGRLAVMLFLAGAIWLARLALPGGWAFVPCRLALWLLWPTLLWWSGVITLAEKQTVLALFQPRLDWMRRRLAVPPSPVEQARFP